MRVQMILYLCNLTSKLLDNIINNKLLTPSEKQIIEAATPLIFEIINHQTNPFIVYQTGIALIT